MSDAVLDLNELARLHEARRLRLVTTVGKMGVITDNDDPDLIIRELLRLARIGQKLETQTAAAVARRQAGAS